MASLGAALCLTRRVKPIGLYLKHRKPRDGVVAGAHNPLRTNMLYVQTGLSPLLRTLFTNQWSSNTTCRFSEIQYKSSAGEMKLQYETRDN